MTVIFVDTRIKYALKIIEENYHKPLRLTEIAKQINVSPAPSPVQAGSWAEL